MNKFVGKALVFVRNNSTTLLSAGAVLGTAATAVFAARAGIQHQKTIEEELHGLTPQSKVEAVKLVWKHYIPPAVCFVATSACVIGSNRVGNRKIVAATMAYSLTEKAFSEYKEKIVEQLGVKKEQAVRDELAAEKVRKNPPPADLVVVSGEVLCSEGYTGRYFKSDMESLRKAVNTLNEKLLKYDQCTLDDFYQLIKLPGTRYSADVGWTSDKLLELNFTTELVDSKPCMVFNYNYVRPLYGDGIHFER